MAEPPIAGRWGAQLFVVQEVPRQFAVPMEALPLVDPMAGQPIAPPIPITVAAHIIMGVPITVALPSELAQVWRLV
jgi:hypothetical protein